MIVVNILSIAKYQKKCSGNEQKWKKKLIRNCSQNSDCSEIVSVAKDKKCSENEPEDTP